MKYLEDEKLTELTAELSDAILGQSHRVINGRIEAYTMKRAGTDKKVAHALGQKYVAEIEEMEQELADAVARRRKRSASAATLDEVVAASAKENRQQQKKAKSSLRGRSQSFDFMLDCDSRKSTLGDFSDLPTRKLMTDLILTLNSSFPDYDFSSVKPNQFEKLKLKSVRQHIYERLSELASFKSEKDWLVEMWMAVNDVIDLKECEVYSFEEEIEESLWSFHYFFVNRSLRRIVFFTCAETIDEERRAEVAEEQMAFYSAEAQLVDDFDWDPSDNVAGGMALPVSSG